MRQDKNYLDRLDIAQFKRDNSWETAQAKFVAALEKGGSPKSRNS
jgi:hypothetical protein